MLRLSIVVTAYNEERNIAQLLRAVLAQRLASGKILEVVVVASGCTDGTVPIVREIMARDERVRLIIQDLRLGKAAALNAYLRERSTDADAVIISSADVIPQPGCLELMVNALATDPKLGMVGGRPCPVNERGTLVGDIVNFQWQLHHERALEVPKLGEIVAFRASLARPLDETTAVDEASLEAHVVAQGYHLGYLPTAVVANRGPTTILQFFEQRRRINAGHLHLKKTTGYSVSTLDWRRTLALAGRHFTITQPRTDVAYLVAIGLEAVARGVGWFDVRREYSHAIWKIIPSAHAAVEPMPSAHVRDKVPGRRSSAGGEG